MNRRRTFYPLWALASIVFLTSGCGLDMRNQPKYKPYRESRFFEDGSSARQLVDGTIPRGFLYEDEALYAGKKDGKLVETFPYPVTKAMIARGQERFNIYCSVCHDRLGTGNGMVVRRGYQAPTSYHIDRLREAPVGHFYDVITHGFGAMPDYASQISPLDRWAIVAYIRALQLSQHAALSDLPGDQQQQLLGKQQ